MKEVKLTKTERKALASMIAKSALLISLRNVQTGLKKMKARRKNEDPRQLDLFYGDTVSLGPCHF